MPSFKYLGRLLKVTDNDWLSVIYNIQKEQKKWARLSSILEREVADTWKSGIFYLAILKDVLIFVADTCLMT